MGLRFGQLAGVAAFALMMGRLGKLFQTGPGEPQWNIILAASAFLGGVAWWLLGQMTSRRWVKMTVFIAAGFLLVTRISSPETLYGGFLPTTSTFAAMADQLGVAFVIIRSGVPPVAANEGLLAILAATMWAIGALFTWGSTGGPYAAVFVPSLVMYLQFAVFDRIEAGLGWMLASGVVLVLGIVSIALERRGESGRARDTAGRPLGRRSMNLAAAMALLLAAGAIFVADSASGVVDEFGNAPWRGGSGAYGSGGGSGTPDRLVDLRQTLLRLSDEPVFEATLGAGAPPANEIYWRVETLDTWDGDTWKRSDTTFDRYEPGQGLANEHDVYQGPTYDFYQRVRILDLRTEVAPTAGVPVEVTEVGESGGRDPSEFNVLSDSALVVTPELVRGDQYEVRTLLADRSQDLGILATGSDGELTAMFQAAADAGDFPYEPGTAPEAVAPPDLDRYLEYPDSTPANIRTRARGLTVDAASDFERAWILQSWFRDSGEFVYSLNVTTGHDSLVLEDWLTDATSINYRTGYCEQFAAAMAVMARTLEIPSRVVWGYTSGNVEPQEDGTEKVVVRDRNAHAWVELWLEPFGWVQFDPTPRSEQEPGFTEQPLSITAGLVPEAYLPENPETPPVGVPDAGAGFLEPGLEFADEEVATPGDAGPRWWLIGLAVGVPLVIALPVYKWVRRRRRLARVREGDITAAWDEIVDRLTDLGVDVSPSLTPIEVARSTDSALVPLAVSYASTIYGGRTGQARDSDLYGAEWWIDRTYDAPARARAAMSIRSLMRRD
jgi:transglutaminase-like putative cysteine protease